MKPFGDAPPDKSGSGSDNDGKSARSAEYTVAGALIGVCLIGGIAAWWLTRDSGDSSAKPPQVAMIAPAAAPATTTAAPASDGGANWQGQLQQEINKLDREQELEQNRAEANEARLADLQKQRDELERERRRLAAQAAAAPPAASSAPTTNSVASARPAPTTNAKPAPQHLAAQIRLDTCASPRYPDVSRHLNEEGRVIIGYQIDEYGKVLNSRIEQSSGSPRLDATAVRALAKCSFTPASTNGVNETSWMQVAFTWKID